MNTHSLAGLASRAAEAATPATGKLVEHYVLFGPAARQRRASTYCWHRIICRPSRRPSVSTRRRQPRQAT